VLWIKNDAFSGGASCTGKIGGYGKERTLSFVTRVVVLPSTWRNDMEYAVELAGLPDKVEFPERLRERIRFDANRRRLVFQGFMTKCTYDELNALTDDAEYHRALEELFVLTSAEVSPPSARHRGPRTLALAAIGVAALVVVMLVVVLRYHPASGSSVAPDNVRLSTVSR